VVPGGFSEPAGAETFFVCTSVAKRPSMFQANHTVQLDELAWLCLDCGLSWQFTDPDGLDRLKAALRDKCHLDIRDRLSGDG
jgi:hypothetical protein